MTDKNPAYKISIPEGLTVSLERGILKIKGAKGEVQKELVNPYISIIKEGSDIILKFTGNKFTRTHKRNINSFRAHINRLLNGVQKGYSYTLKICSGHFPMSVNINSGVLTVKNFLGEKVPRKVKLVKGVDVKLEGDLIKVNGIDKELVGRVSSLIEQSTIITNRDRRIFQDGIYLIAKEDGN